jgi:aryl-alcohol dehydrogenase-like predicted oxidoreductase
MQERQLGQNGPMVGAVGLGCMSFAGFYGPTDVAESHRTLARAQDLGVTHLDTAELYGRGLSEQVIGDFIKDHPNRFSIATKGGIIVEPKRHFDNSEGQLRQSLEGSLKRLGVDHIDLYYVHRREPVRPIEEVAETLATFVTEGKIGGFGFSEIAPSSLRRASAVHPVRAVQSEYSLWSRMPEMGMIQACRELGTAFVAFSPLARGMFSEVLPAPDNFGPQDFRANNPRFETPNFEMNCAAVERFNDYAICEGTTPAAMALAWVLNQGPHVVAIPGTRSPDHLSQNAEGGSLVLNDLQLAEIDRLLPRGFAHGDRYSDRQLIGVERYC